MFRFFQILLCCESCVRSSQQSSQNGRLEHRKTLTLTRGRAIAQVVSHRVPTAAARVRARVKMRDLWWTERHWTRFPPSTVVSPATYSFH
jgi:hypothetical protein